MEFLLFFPKFFLKESKLMFKLKMDLLEQDLTLTKVRKMLISSMQEK